MSFVMGAILVMSVAGAFSPAAEGNDWDIVLVWDVGEKEDIYELVKRIRHQ